MRLPATSIVESITAMVIILLSFGVGMMIYLNVLRSEKMISKTKANLVLNQMRDKMMQEQLFFDEKIQTENLWIVRTVTAYPRFENTYAVKLEAFNQKGASILSFREIVFNPPKP